MNILLTGCTTVQVNGRRKATDYVSPFNILHDLLREMGHEVDWRIVVPGEDLEQYDMALIGLQPLYALNTVKHKFGALWAMEHTRHAMIIDDCQWRTIKNTLNSADTFWKSSHLGGSQLSHWERACPFSEQIERRRKRLQRGYGAMLSTGFWWGDKTRFDDVIPTEHHHFWDPSPWVPMYGRPSREVVKQWACAALGNKDEWVDAQHCSWPVVRQYKPSTKGMAQGTGEKLKWDRIPESEVVSKLYAHSAGIMAPVKGVDMTWVGTGWWRVRFNYALQQVRRPMLCDPREVDALGSPFEPRAPEIEFMSDGERQQLHFDQRGVFEENAPPAMQTLRELSVFLERVSQRGVGE